MILKFSKNSLLCRAAIYFAAAALFFGVSPVESEADSVAGSDSKPVTTVKWTAPDQEDAIKRATEVPKFVSEVVDECRLCRQQRLRDIGLSVKEIPNSYFLLDSPIIRKVENQYGSVRFMHSKHASLFNDCALCHHYRPKDPTAQETVKCSACHQGSFRADAPDRIGLKAAYHQQCMGCHKEMNQGPIDCTGCHMKNVPDHTELVQLTGNPEPSEVTQECLRCHDQAGEDMLASAHWLWKGPSTHTLEHRTAVHHGKATTAVNNF